MNRKFKLLILSMLGLSAACTGVKNNAKSQPEPQRDSVEVPNIRLMYGVRRPDPVAKVDTLATDSLDARNARTGTSPEVKNVETEQLPRIQTMYGVRVPMENIDLDSLKRAQREREAKAGNDEE